MILNKKEETKMWLFEAPKTYTEVCKKVAQAVFYIVLIILNFTSIFIDNISNIVQKEKRPKGLIHSLIYTKSIL